MIEFFIAAKVGVKGNSKQIFKRGGRVFVASKPEDKAKEVTLTNLLLGHRPGAPLTGPLSLDVTFVFPLLKSFPAWKREAALAGYVLPDKRPDRGNCLKLLEDAMEKAGFYNDDAQIVGGRVEKTYGEVAGYHIRLSQLEHVSTAAEWKREE